MYIAKDPADLPPSVGRNTPEEVNVEIEAQRSHWRNGAEEYTLTIGLTTAKCRDPSSGASGRQNQSYFEKSPTSLHHHSIDLHVVNGPGGGATVTMVEPGPVKTFFI